jgi:hypothetical protein
MAVTFARLSSTFLSLRHAAAYASLISIAEIPYAITLDYLFRFLIFIHVFH